MTFTTTDNEGAIQNWMQDAHAEPQRQPLTRETDPPPRQEFPRDH